MPVLVRSEHPRGRAAARRLRTRALAFLERLGKADRELSVLLVTDRAIRSLNRRWRGLDRATDVLSFPLGPGSGPLLGDVVISMDMAARRGRAEGRDAISELERYLAHGLLHLLGYDHERAVDAARMAKKEEDLLKSAGLVSGTLARSG